MLLPGRFGGHEVKFRHDRVRLDLALTQGGQIVADRFFGIEPDLTGIGADKSLVEHTAGKLIEALIFESLQHARAYFGGIGDGLERDPALFPLTAKFFSELAHVCSAGRQGGFRPPS